MATCVSDRSTAFFPRDWQSDYGEALVRYQECIHNHVGDAGDTRGIAGTVHAIRDSLTGAVAGRADCAAAVREAIAAARLYMCGAVVAGAGYLGVVCPPPPVIGPVVGP